MKANELIRKYHNEIWLFFSLIMYSSLLTLTCFLFKFSQSMAYFIASIAVAFLICMTSFYQASKIDIKNQENYEDLLQKLTDIEKGYNVLQNAPDSNDDIDSKWVEEFYRLYCSNDPENNKKARNLLNKNLPKKICRYMNPESANQFIADSKLTFSHPKKFEDNDKYDSRWFKFIPCEEYPDKINDYLNNWQIQCEAKTDPYFNIHKICCFTTDPLDPYMWEYYADKSSGICIEFCKDRPDLKSYEILTRISEKGVILLPVLYTKERRDLSELLLSLENSEPGIYSYYKFDHLLLNLKKIDFSSEKEWRAFCYKNNYNKDNDSKNNGLKEKLSTETIPTNIYLGAYISEELKNKILTYAEDHNISVYQVEINKLKLN